MLLLRMMLAEIVHRKGNFLSALIAVTTAAAICVGVITVCDASRRETVRLMRDMGFNLLIVPEGTDMTDFWSRSFAEGEMPEEYVRRLADSGLMTVQHLVARLQKRITWQGRDVLLTGILPEMQMTGGPVKAPMGLDIPRGSAYLGRRVADSAGLGVGDEIELLGRRLRVATVLEEQGSIDDIRVYAHLHDVQEMLDRPGRINEIEALQCLCGSKQSLGSIRDDVRSVLPGVEVTEMRSIAIARAETRRMVERFNGVLVPAVVLMATIWVGLAAMRNVNDRRVEIGVLRALGVASQPIAALFLAKMMLIGLIGAVVGWAVGTALAVHYGTAIFPITAKGIAPIYALLGWAAVGAALLCLVASWLPAMSAVMQDPAEVLSEE